VGNYFEKQQSSQVIKAQQISWTGTGTAVSTNFTPQTHSRARSRWDPALYKPADIVTCPVLYKPMARAAAGDRSMSRPRTQGPRSLMRTVTHPLWQTRI
jgi:hypothetical protein